MMNLEQRKIDTLIDAAITMSKNARAPYSKYFVGAAVLAADGSIVGGCNIENTSLSLTCCAERVALFSAIAQGHTSFVSLAVATRDCSSPCGACRQVLWDLCKNIPIITCDFEKRFAVHSLESLLPNAYNNHNTYLK
jgi:cytidine deaminase